MLLGDLFAAKSRKISGIETRVSANTSNQNRTPRERSAGIGRIGDAVYIVPAAAILAAIKCGGNDEAQSARRGCRIGDGTRGVRHRRRR